LAGGLEPLERALARTPFVGLDLNPENLRTHLYTRRCVLADGTHLPFKDESFDLITSNMVVEHLREPRIAFTELNRVLAPGGTILLHTPNLANYLVFTNRVVSAVLPRRVHAALVATSEKRAGDEIYPAFYRANTHRSLRKLASPIGQVTVEFLPGPRPFFHYFTPLAMVELLLTRLSQFAPFRRFSTTLLVSIGKPSVTRGQTVPEVERNSAGDTARESAA
jgi:SAM-dependent methyltransferase